MDYEQKYKEALERVRRLYDRMLVLSSTDALVASAELEFIFPELAESDDERIRKELKEAFEAYDIESKWNGIPIRSIFAWLEKQKENPKSSDSIPSDCTSDAKCEDRWHKVSDSLPDNGRLVLANDCLGNTLLARYDGEGNWEVSVYDNEDYYCRNTITKWCEIPSENQKEQIPYTDFVIKPHKGDDNNPYDMQVSEAQEYAINRGFGIPFNDGEVFVDERYITQTIGNILRWADEHPKEQKKKNVLIWGEPQVTITVQKQEWSEADDEMLEYVIGDLNDAKQLFSAKDAIDLCDKEIAWLKSLPMRCPKSSDNWKPSEEQMKALEAATVRYQSTGLESLYEELKKL